MDEPTAALSDRETELLFAMIERLKKKGVAIIYISHRLSEVFALGDRIAVLRDGKKIASRGPVRWAGPLLFGGYPQWPQSLLFRGRLVAGRAAMNEQTRDQLEHPTSAPANQFQNLHELVSKARDNLDQNAWDYIIGGTETETTLRRNRWRRPPARTSPARRPAPSSPAGAAFCRTLRPRTCPASNDKD